jgi:rhomboid protease GluP
VDLQLLLAVNIMAITGMGLVSLLARRDWRMASEIAIQASILLFGGVALALGWPEAGTLVAALFVVLIVVPSVLTLIANRKTAKGDADAAARYAQWTAWVHPTPVMRMNARVIAAQAIADPLAAAAALREIAATASLAYAMPLQLAALRAEDRWDSILALLEKEEASGKDLAAYKIRALGEAGRLEDMVTEYQKHRNHFPADMRIAAELFVLAFCGRRDGVSARVDGKHAPHNEDTRRYWKAIAARNAGKSDHGMLEALAHTSRLGTTQRAAARHVRQGPILAANVLSPQALAAVEAIETRIGRATAISSLPRSHALATQLLLLANSVMFALEFFGGGVEDNKTLYGLGALWPPSVIEGGEWWRLVTAFFLHFGWTHFAINMFSLFALGQAIEARFGTWRMLLIYMLGGIGSCGGVLALMHYGVAEGDFLVGASGAIMALFGGLAAYQFVTWLRTRDVLDRRPVLALAGIVAVQFAMDMSIPQVSLAGHASGMAVGFLVALPLAMRLVRPANR